MYDCLSWIWFSNRSHCALLSVSGLTLMWSNIKKGKSFLSIVSSLGFDLIKYYLTSDILIDLVLVHTSLFLISDWRSNIIWHLGSVLFLISDWSDKIWIVMVVFWNVPRLHSIWASTLDIIWQLRIVSGLVWQDEVPLDLSVHTGLFQTLDPSASLSWPPSPAMGPHRSF